MEIRLSDSFTYKKLIRYVLPCIAMMIMTSIYSIVGLLCLQHHRQESICSGQSGHACADGDIRHMIHDRYGRQRTDFILYGARGKEKGK